MKFLLWEIKIEPYRLAKIQWILFKIFGYKPKKYPCGHTKSANGYYCHQPFDLKHCKVINEEKIYVNVVVIVIWIAIAILIQMTMRIGLHFRHKRFVSLGMKKEEK